MRDNLLSTENAISWSKAVFKKAGASENDATILATSLVNTSLWGIDSHGIARIPHYLNRFKAGSINITPNIKFNRTAAAAGRLDGDDGHGIIIMNQATHHSITLAKEAGIGAIGVENSSHCGAIGLYTRQITEAGMVGIAFTHSDSFVVPHNGKKAFFGTNPISIAFPSENRNEPICLDMATSIIPWNYIMNAKREGALVPLGYGVDKNGNDTQAADDIVAVKPTSLHKGYAMAFLIDMLCGPLNGMAFGPNITPMYDKLDQKRKLGSFIIAIDPNRFGGKDSIKIIGTAIINMLKQADEKILFPGEPEYISKKIRTEKGIPVTDALAQEFRECSNILGVDSPVYLDA